MVVFTCNHCGEALKKQAVEKHYQWKSCRSGGIFVSCMDCMKGRVICVFAGELHLIPTISFSDFREQEYVAHTKCITEAEKYSGKDYVPKPSQNKGQRKQEAWIDIIQSVLDRPDISQSVRSTLNMLTRHENVPRKRPKFANFMKNVSRSTSVVDVNRVFDLIEEAYKSAKEEQEAADTTSKSSNGKAESNGEAKEDKKEPETAAEAPSATLDEPTKKKKKRKADAVAEESVIVGNADPVKKKKKKAGKSEETTNGKTDETTPTNGHTDGSDSGFKWKETIRSLVAEKGDSIKLTKLQTKVLKAYKKQTGDTETVNENTIDCVLKRKLKKMKNISIQEDRVVLSSN